MSISISEFKTWAGQNQNAAVAGFMSGSVASIAERLGGKAYHTFHRGGADRIAK